MIINLGNYDIKINRDIIRNIYQYRQLKAHAYEAGGMLIGSVVKDSKSIIIEDLTVPIDEDIRSRYSYVRSGKHNDLLEQKWKDSQYTRMYFGEWHTHPQNNPSPSS